MHDAADIANEGSDPNTRPDLPPRPPEVRAGPEPEGPEPFFNKEGLDLENIRVAIDNANADELRALRMALEEAIERKALSAPTRSPSRSPQTTETAIMATHMWAPNWERRIIREAKSFGFPNLTSLLAVMPSRPYKDVSALFENAAPIQIIDVQFLEARSAGRVRDAAKDCLCRNVSERFPDGWGIGERADRQAILMLAGWQSEIEVTGECEELAPILTEVARALLQLPPPRGWLPKGPDDPIIESVFNAHWPTE